MEKMSFGAFLIVGLGLCLWAQAPQQGQQPAGKAASTEQKTSPPAAGKNSTVPADPSDESRTWTETTEYPLDKFKNFSAIMNGGPLPDMTSDVYIYRSENLMRMQGTRPRPDYYVTDLTKRETHLVAPHACLDMGSAQVHSFPFFVPQPGNTYEISEGGEETVDGHVCKVEYVRIHRPKSPVIPEFKLYEAEDLDGFPIKIENHRKGAYHWTITYKRVRLEAQDPSLFIYPEKCQSDKGWMKGSGADAGGGKTKKPKTAPPAKPKE